MPSSASVDNASRQVPSAANVGVTSVRTCVHIRTGKVRDWAFVRKIDTTTSSQLVTNANNAPAAIPGSASGSTTLTC